MFEGCTADPKEMASLGRALEPLMGGEGQVHLTTPFGTDFRFRIDKRPLDYSYGLATEEKAERGEVVFLPSGGIEVSAAEDSAEGRIVYDPLIRTGQGLVEYLTLKVAQAKTKSFRPSRGTEIYERYLG